MFTSNDIELFERIERSDFHGAILFVANVRKQGFMTSKQRTALQNMRNSIRPWTSRKHPSRRADGWDHDDLYEGWDGF